MNASVHIHCFHGTCAVLIAMKQTRFHSHCQCIHIAYRIEIECDIFYLIAFCECAMCLVMVVVLLMLLFSLDFHSVGSVIKTKILAVLLGVHFNLIRFVLVLCTSSDTAILCSFNLFTSKPPPPPIFSYFLLSSSLLVYLATSPFTVPSPLPHPHQGAVDTISRICIRNQTKFKCISSMPHNSCAYN